MPILKTLFLSSVFLFFQLTVVSAEESTRIVMGNLTSSTTGASPKLEIYLPVEKGRSDIGVIIFPGGGYRGLAEHEGAGYAHFFQSKGIAAFVVEYRLAPGGHKHPAMLEDALAAIQTVRSRAAEFGVDPIKVGVMGSSAGGHLAAHTVTAYGEYSEKLRPAFGVLCYPVVEMDGVYTHKGSRQNLLGEAPSRELKRSVSPELKVTTKTPPCFIWHTVEDPVVPVENSLIFASALQAHGVPFELHVFPKGRHGLGMKTDYGWEDSLVRWLGKLFE
ncbi:MAG: alpha/beta hydrolase [Verrucomicrobia bacterium]|nr:alpha/beta hydrolase [Verrucomicrobiota bacterium]MDA1068519.1 alpha/beta hydrolase [Verrucomicrobiota bacterium]